MRLGTQAPWLHVVAKSVSDLTNSIWQAQSPSVAVRFVRGQRMRTTERVFDELSAALQFPFYFGYNWDALSECLADLSWMLADSFLVVVTDADLALCDEPSEFAVLAHLVEEIGREWSEESPTARPWAPSPRPFHWLLHTEPERKGKLVDALRASGVEFDVVLDVSELLDS